jgi:hypothetical protein
MALNESDWKLLKRLHPIALERYCEGVLKHLDEIRTAPGLNSYERYAKIYEFMRRRDKTLGRIFDDLKRSNAELMLAQLRLHDLVTIDELAALSLDTRNRVAVIAEGLAHPDE